MRKANKWVGLTMAVVLAAGMLSGCGNSGKKESAGQEEAKESQTGESSDEDKVITFWHIGTDEPDVSLYEDAAEAFNENTDTGYKIESVAMEADAYKEKLLIAMSSGECPDIYTNWSGGPMNEYVEAGFAQPLDELYEKAPWKDKILDATVAQGKYNDKLYGVGMINVSVSGIYYNKDIFAQYNLEVPKTVSELEKVCDTLVENGKIPFALANAPKWTGSMYFMNLATRKGGLEPFSAAVDGSGSFEDECFIYAGEKIQDWVKKGYFPEGVNSLSEGDGQSKQLFYSEEAAMKMIGSWESATYKADSEEFYNKLGWFPFPAVDGSDADSSIQIGTMGDQFISFNCEGEKLEAAFELLNYYFEEAYTERMVEAGKIPPVKGVDALIDGELEKEIITKVEEASATQLWYDQYLPPAVSTVHLDTCQELFGLTMTPEEAAKQFQAAMEEYNSEQSE
jgi:raffinose/stachyose/melibiose transport system substrate-binding protein